MKKNLLDELIDLKGGVQNAVEHLNRRGVKVTVGRYNQWLSGKFHPKYETISIILEEITDFTLSPSSVQHVVQVYRFLPDNSRKHRFAYAD